MPLFNIANNDLKPIPQSSFKTEKQFQQMIEANLVAAFNSRFVASEFRTGAQHAGRIDTLALSEDNNPVIIEYKIVESSDLITQSLFYLHWLADHRGDFEMSARKKLGNSIEIDWSDIRVICIAPNYKRYDLHAVQVMGANIELWRYRLFANSSLYLEEVYRQALRAAPDPTEPAKNPVMVEAGKKARITAMTGSYTLDQHFVGKPEKICKIAVMISDFLMSLDPTMQETPKKFYIAYKVSQNVVCMEVKKQRVTLFLKLDPKTVAKPPKNSRDVSEIGHYGTGDFEIVLESEQDAAEAFPFIRAAYNEIGG